MRKVNKRFHKLFLESLQGRGQPIPKVEWRPILTEKEGMAPYFSAKVSVRETAIKIYDSTAEQNLCLSSDRRPRDWMGFCHRFSIL